MGENKNNPVRVASEGHLSFLYDLYTQGVAIGAESVSMLRDAGYFKDKEETPEILQKEKRKNIIEAALKSEIKGRSKSNTDALFDIVEEGTEESPEALDEDEYEERQSKKKIIYEGKKIQKSDWLPNSTTEHTKEFIEWIDSINFLGFQNRTKYRPQQLYVQQAKDWIAEDDSITNYTDQYDIEEYQDRELQRCDDNTLYFLNKYLKLQEPALEGGIRHYEGTEAHEILAFMMDCGYSFALGKPRQMAATSTLGGIAVKNIVFKPNYFIKFITQDKEKGEEIYNDKIKYPFTQLPDWMRPDMLNWTDNFLKVGRKGDKKGSDQGQNSRVQVVAPSKTAISGGTPSLAMIDEAGNIGILTQIIENGNPTMYWQNPVTKKIELKRQLVFWGTGGDMEKGGKAFEREFMSLIKMWQARNFKVGIIPIFLDWTARPGIDKDFYDQKKIEFYSKEGPDAKDSKTEFHQQYPTTIAEMFLSTHKTLVDSGWINEQILRIRKAKMKARYGYFEPIYGDIVQPENSDIPFNIIGANFVPVENEADPRMAAIIFSDRKPWEDRYYNGTDPIASDNGLSEMAGSVWDAHFNTLAAVVKHRSPNYKETFLQVMLLGIYYNTNEHSNSTQELLESNIGLAYREYKTNKGFGDSLVYNSELPQYLQTGSGQTIGIDNKGMRNKLIIDKLYELILAYGERIYIEEFFTQLQTFVCTITEKGNETWGPVDRKYYKDDVLFSTVFAYICRMCYLEKIPRSTELEGIRTEIYAKTELVYDSEWRLTRKTVKARRRK